MSKSQLVTVLVPNVRIAKGVVQQVKFGANLHRIKCSTKGHPPIIVRANANGGKRAAFEATIRGADGVCVGRTPKRAFARAVRVFWSA